MKLIKLTSLLFLALAVTLPCQAQNKKKGKRDSVSARFKADLTIPDDMQARLDNWFTDAKFGAFIHFGAYSHLEGSYKGRGQKHKYAEWIQMSANIPAKEYRDEVISQFNPVDFDADEWVKVFKEVGMRYVVITAKHHDGFALYDSAVSDLDVMDASPFKRDIIKELSDSCKRHGLRFGVYYSQAQDWSEPNALLVKKEYNIRDIHPELPADFKPDLDSYIDSKAIPQVVELMKNYKPDLIWFDTPNGLSYEQAERFRDAVREHNPDCVINSRIFLKAIDPIEQKHLSLFDYVSVGDKKVPSAPVPLYFESPDSVTTSYGYKTKGPCRYHTDKELIHRLVYSVCSNGNYLLNNGPMGNGKLDPKAVELYRIMGEWMKVNGESIWDTRANPFGKRPAWGDVSINKAGDVLYLHVLKWPKSGKLSLQGVSPKVAGASFLANGAAADVQQQGATVNIKLPAKPLDKYNTVIKLSLSSSLK